MPIKRPYQRTTVIHTKTEIESWEKITFSTESTVTPELRGKTCYVSPAFGVLGKERNHHSIEVKSEGPGFVNFYMGHAPNANKDQYDKVFSTYYYTVDFLRVGIPFYKKDYPAAYGGRAFNWWIVEANQTRKITEIKHTYHQCPDGLSTHWLHDHPVKSYSYMGGSMKYSMSYPPDYDSEDKTKKYPLVISVGGSASLGNNGNILTQTDPGCVIVREYNHFFNYPAFHLTIQIPFGSEFTEKIEFNKHDSRYHPSYITSYGQHYYGAIGCRGLINQLLSDPDHNIDSDRIYLTGFSGGGLFSYEMLMGGRDIFAAIIPIAAWAIGGPYSNVLADTKWNSPLVETIGIKFIDGSHSGIVFKAISSDGSNVVLQDVNNTSFTISIPLIELQLKTEAVYKESGESYKDRLTKEFLRGKHIPTIVAAGSNDDMKYGTEAYKIVSDENGGNCQMQILAGAGHTSTTQAFWAKEENVKWMFNQVKIQNIPIDPYPDGDYSKPPVVPKIISVEDVATSYLVYLDNSLSLETDNLQIALDHAFQLKKENQNSIVNLKEVLDKVIKYD